MKMKNETNEILSQILKTLDEAGYSVSEVDSEDYCLEIVAKKGNIKLLIKTLLNVDSERRETADDLRKLAASFSASPLIIGSRMQNGIIEEGALYERFGVNVINPATFREAALNGTLPIVYSKRGGLYVKIDGDALKRHRAAQGMSLGNLASKIGVSRKAVYEYEREQMGATLATVAKIEEVIKANVITGINIFAWTPFVATDFKPPTSEVARQLHNKLREIGCKAMGFNYAPIDVHMHDADVGFLTNEHLRDAELERKVDNAVHVGKILGMAPILVTKERCHLENDITTIKIDEISCIKKKRDLESLLRIDLEKSNDN